MCTSPNTAYLPLNKNKDGKLPLLFKLPPESLLDQFEKIQVPCNHCIDCEKLRSLRTAIQFACELNTTKGDSYFLTLTYNDENLPSDFSVNKKHIQDFIRKLRRYRNKNNHNGKFRYTSRGEYGGQFNRPHYHLTAFNLKLDDLQIYSDSGQYKLYESPTLTDLWSKGDIKINHLTFENCLYIAQHHFDDKVELLGKIHQYKVQHPLTNEIINLRQPEFSTRSSKPGIGAEFFNQYFTDIFPHDEMIQKGKKFPVPKYFDTLLKRDNPELYEDIKQLRKSKIDTRTNSQNRYKNGYNIAVLKTKKSIKR